jgi:hypothetical protein
MDEGEAIGKQGAQIGLSPAVDDEVGDEVPTMVRILAVRSPPRSSQ